MSTPISWADEARLALNTLGERTSDLISPTVRLGVTGLSRAGKTVFITALIHALSNSARLPIFKPWRENRLGRGFLEHQPDDTVARFHYEEHMRSLIEAREWPQSTRNIAQLRIHVPFQPQGRLAQLFSRNHVIIDIVDYPGEWLLDLPLLSKDYKTFSQESFARARERGHQEAAKQWLEFAHTIDPKAKADEDLAQKATLSFTQYLRAAKQDAHTLFMLPPGRFLMPGDMEGAPALTFVPLELNETDEIEADSLAHLMQRRYESYKKHIVKPFFMDHIARLDRQIVLIDAMQAINGGVDAIEDMRRALAEILACFRPGRNKWHDWLWQRRISHVLVAATKADHVHHEHHDQLENLTRQFVDSAAERAGLKGAAFDVVAMAAIRAAHEARLSRQNGHLPVIVGTPQKGEQIGDDIFDGETETAIFPGDLPYNLDDITQIRTDEQMRFVRFRPPIVQADAPFPHIRLDRALQFLFGDVFE